MKTQNALIGEKPILAPNSNFDLGVLFDGHIAREFADFDVDATMENYGSRALCALRRYARGGLRRPGSPSLLQRALHKSNSQRCETA